MIANNKITTINKFKIKKAITTLFDDKNEKIFSTILFDFIINENKNIDKHYLKLFMEHIRNHELLNNYNIKTKNQHYLKQEIQSRWNDKIIIHNKDNNVVYSGFELLSDFLLNLNDKEKSKFSTEKIGTSDHTFTYFNDKAIAYNENGIVTLIEDTICLFERKNIIDIEDIYFKILSYFCSGTLYHRKKAIEDFSEILTKHLLSSGDDLDVNIDEFIKSNLKNKIEIKVYKSNNDIFSLNNEWSTKINLEGIGWELANIIPISPRTAILMCDSSDRLNYIIRKFNRLENNGNIDVFLLLNAMLNEMERLYSLDNQKEQVFKNYYRNSIIGIPNKQVYNRIINTLPINFNKIKYKEEHERMIYILINKM